MKKTIGISCALGVLAIFGSALLMRGHAAFSAAENKGVNASQAQKEPVRLRTEPQPVENSWDDLLAGVKTLDDWKARKEVLRRRYLELIRDAEKPAKPP